MPPLFALKEFLVNPRTTLDKVLEQISQTDLIITDLDDTDAPSPAKAIAYSYLNFWRRADVFFSSSFWRWAIPCATDLLFRGHAAEEPQWHAFRERFLHPAELERQVAWYQANAGDTVYPGLKEFYRHFGGAKKVYVSRNLQPIADAYACALGFDRAFGNTYDEAEGIQKVLQEYPCQRNVLFKGDAIRDEQILAGLKRHQLSGRITTLIGVCVSASLPQRPGTPFDLTIPRDYTPLSLALSRFRYSRSLSRESCACAPSQQTSPLILPCKSQYSD